MIILAFTACVIGTTPELCKDNTITFLENRKWVTPWQCNHYGQAELAKWKSTHPDYRVVKFKCVPKENQEHEI